MPEITQAVWQEDSGLWVPAFYLFCQHRQHNSLPLQGSLCFPFWDLVKTCWRHTLTEAVFFPPWDTENSHCCCPVGSRCWKDQRGMWAGKKISKSLLHLPWTCPAFAAASACTSRSNLCFLMCSRIIFRQDSGRNAITRASSWLTRNWAEEPIRHSPVLNIWVH